MAEQGGSRSAGWKRVASWAVAGLFVFAGCEAARDGGGAEAPTIPHPDQDIFVGEVPCPVVMDNGLPRSHKAPCRQERDAMDPNVARIYNADGVLIGGSAL